jgi:2-octaprenyl-6-methoxyphenol hydroxylase
MVSSAAFPSSAETTAGLDTAKPQLLQVDVAIVGGGIVGLTLAAALRHSGLRIAVIEAQTLEQAASQRRAYAFSLASAEIFKRLGLWNEITPRITHFQKVRLQDSNYPQTVEFSPQDLGSEAVYYGAEHTVLMGALQRCLQHQAGISYLSSAQVVALHAGGTAAANSPAATLEVLWNQQPLTVQAMLAVAADGGRSPLRQQAGISTFGWKYWQSCITAMVKPELPHQETAYERFWPSGPFAILPLPDNRCQIVWTAPHAEAQAMLSLPRPQFMHELQQRYGDQMGRLTLLSEPLLFPVQLMQSKAYVQPRLALIGDAAHCCHPVGGQGLNMGIRDAAALAEVLLQAHHQAQDLGSLAVLRRYERWRRRENWLILSFTDFLTRCFSNQVLPLLLLRRLGILILRLVRPFKRLALQLMTGRFGRLPRLP